MSFNYLTIFVPAVLITAVVLSVLATRRIHRDVSFTSEQRSMQMWLIWLVPILGAALVLAVLRDEPAPERGRISMRDNPPDPRRPA